jgi:hypothetical protein
VVPFYKHSYRKAPRWIMQIYSFATLYKLK